MRAALPRKVVYDPCAEHHLSVWVHRDRGYFDLDCVECETHGRYPMESLSEVWPLVKDAGDVQVVVWLEFNGRRCDGEAVV